MYLFFDNIIFELQRAGGISVYWAELLSRHSLDYKSYFGRKNSNIFASYLHLNLKDEVYPNFVPRRYFPFWPKSDYAKIAKYIFHSSYFRYSNNSNAINVTTVHDFTYEYYSHGLRKWVHGWQKKNAVKKSAGIICVSENTKIDLLKFYPWVDKSRIKVIYNGVSDDFSLQKDAYKLLNDQLGFQHDRPYILFVGDRSPYKNFDVFLGLADKLPEYDLVVVGGQDFNNDEKQKIFAIKDRVHHFRGISPQHLNLLYNAAFCLIYPSSYEGFGIPVLEAMKSGCPVVSTNLSSIPEVAGGAALLVDTVTVNSMFDQVKRLENTKFRDIIISKGIKQASQFSWDKCFEETYAFYQELWERSEIK